MVVATAGLCAAACMLAPTRAAAQQSYDGSRSDRILEFPNLGPIPGAAEPALGPGPGAFDAEMATASPNLIGGRRRTSVLPRGVRGRGRTAVNTGQVREYPAPQPLPEPSSPLGMAVPITIIDRSLADDEGSPTGLTLDEAIDRMMQSNLDIRAIRQELPQADADILTAGLRTNPLLYMDTQFIPYDSFSNQKPGGPTQYDLNLTLPIDVSQKRKARVVVARMAKSALEAQFQDLVRRKIDAVCRAFVNLQAARLNRLATNDSLDRCERMLAERRAAAPSEADDDRIERLAIAVERTKLAAIEATEAFADAQESLAVLLNEPTEAATRLEPRGGLKDSSPPPPSVDELVKLSLQCRPDVLAMRRGVGRARAEVSLQRANAYDDLYLFYDPLTVQDFGPFHQPSASSWAVGLTFSVPIFNRNQGNIAKAENNVSQTRNELSAMERRVESEVRLAEREYRTSRAALERIEQGLLPLASASLRRRADAFERGVIDADALQEELEDAAAVAQSHREALVRHRRSMLELNTAIGLRILP